MPDETVAGRPLQDIPSRTFEFGVRVIRLCMYLDRRSGSPRVLSAQLLRAATSIGANVEEGQAAQSLADFVSKYSIAFKEVRESHFRLRLLDGAGIVSHKRLAGLLDEAEQLKAILAKALLTAKRRLGKRK
jgi:four helix bundle protein